MKLQKSVEALKIGWQFGTSFTIKVDKLKLPEIDKVDFFLELLELWQKDTP